MTTALRYFDYPKEEEKFPWKTDYSFLAKQAATLLATFAVTDNFKSSACQYCIFKSQYFTIPFSQRSSPRQSAKAVAPLSPTSMLQLKVTRLKPVI